MNIEPPTRDPDTEPFEDERTGERKRAAALLGVLAIAAVLLVGIMVYALGSSKDSSAGKTDPVPAGPAVTVTDGAPSTTAHSSGPKTKPRASTSAASSSRNTGPASCPTSAACALPDDVGNAVQALNAYRSAHHQRAVTGSVTTAAKQCALNNGDGSTCPAGYFWEPVGPSGSQVIDKIAANGGGTGWLLDPKMTSVQVGWVYQPSSKSYECVLVSNA